MAYNTSEGVRNVDDDGRGIDPVDSSNEDAPARNLRGQATMTDVVDAARAEIIDRGVASTTIASIAARAGVTRTLFYHYFPNKEAVVEAVLDDVIDTFLADLASWNAAREVGNVSKALDDAVVLMRRIIAEDGPFREGLAVRGNAGMYVTFIDRTARRIADYIAETTVRDYATRHRVAIEHVHETFYMLIVGLISLIRSRPDVPDVVIKRIAAQTLHIEGLVDWGPVDVHQTGAREAVGDGAT